MRSDEQERYEVPRPESVAENDSALGCRQSSMNEDGRHVVYSEWMVKLPVRPVRVRQSSSTAAAAATIDCHRVEGARLSEGKAKAALRAAGRGRPANHVPASTVTRMVRAPFSIIYKSGPAPSCFPSLVLGHVLSPVRFLPRHSFFADCKLYIRTRL